MAKTFVLCGCGMTDHQIGVAGRAAGSSGGGAFSSGGSSPNSGGTTDLGMGAAGAPGEGGTMEGAAGASGEGNGGGPSGCVFLVDAAAGNDEQDGRTWASALATVGAAFERASSGCEVWLASGEYLPGNTRESTFAVPDNVTVRGGFAGREKSEGERDPNHAPTVLSGDLGTRSDASDNAYHVVTTLGTATLERITVSGGNADRIATDVDVDVDADVLSDAEDYDSGGGVFAGGLLELVDVIVSDNRAVERGGGVYAPLGLSVSGGAFELNVAGADGGAIWATAPFQVTIHGGRFEQNQANHGGAVWASGPSVQIVDASFTANVSAGQGGAVSSDRGSALVVGRSTFDANRGVEGGAVFAWGPLSFSSSTVSNTQPGSSGVVCYSALLVDDSQFSDNESGAVAVRFGGSGCSGIVRNSTFLRNRGYDGGGIHAYSCQLEVTHSRFESNHRSTGGAIDFVDFLAPGHYLNIEDSVFEGNSSDGEGSAIYNWGGHGVITRSRFEANSGGSPVYAWQSSSMGVHQSRFVDNVADAENAAGALHLSSTSGAIVDSEFARNQGARSGAILLLGSELHLSGVSIAGNVGNMHGYISGVGGGLDSYGAVSILDSIIWGNEPVDIAANEYEVGKPADPDIRNSNFTDNDYQRAYDPRFVDFPADLRLRSDSPCIDTGSDNQVIDTDLLGRDPVDIEGVPTCPANAPTCGSVGDMGAYEYIP